MLNRVKQSIKGLTKFEWALWAASVLVITVSFMLLKDRSYMTLTASLIGVTALIFVAKGDVLGQVLTVVFSLFYAVISVSFKYYGEMITYMFMTAPMAAMAVVSWLRNPYSETEVKVNQLGKWEWLLLAALTAAVTAVFYFILAALGNANLGVSTLSITTSFLASYLTFRRSPFYALAYAANDLVLIALWIMASIADMNYFPMIMCFVMFFANDMYGFINWSEMRKRQMKESRKITE